MNLYAIAMYKDGELVKLLKTGTDDRRIRIYESMESAERGYRAVRPLRIYEQFEMKIVPVRIEEGAE